MRERRNRQPGQSSPSLFVNVRRSTSYGELYTKDCTAHISTSTPLAELLHQEGKKETDAERKRSSQKKICTSVNHRNKQSNGSCEGKSSLQKLRSRETSTTDWGKEKSPDVCASRTINRRKRKSSETCASRTIELKKHDHSARSTTTSTSSASVPETEMTTLNRESEVSDSDKNKDTPTTADPEQRDDVPVNLKCIYTNADSVLNKRKELEATIASINPDIIAITEVLPKNVKDEVQRAELEIEGFDCFANLEGRGECIYVRKILKAVPVGELTNMDYDGSIWLEIRLKNCDKLLLGCIYRSPSSSAENNTNLCQLINSACNRGSSHLLIVGDFNYSEICWESFTSSGSGNHPSWLLLDCLQNNFLYQLVDFPTRYREGQKPSLLDLIIVNEEGMISDIDSRNPLGKSDHVVISFSLTCYMDETDSSQTERYLYNKGDFESMREELKAVNWEREMEREDANTCWKVFANKLQESMERNIPKAKPRQKNEEKPRKPLWMNRSATSKVKKKYHAWKRYTNTRQYHDYQMYCKARNEATREVRKAKKSFEKKLADEIKADPKSFWKYVRSKTKVKRGVSDLTREDGSTAHTDDEKADELNKFFCSVSTIENDENIPEPEMKHDGTKLTDVKVLKEDVEEKLANLNPAKSPGPDGLHPRVLKEVAEEIAVPLTMIFNKSLQEGVVPEEWKIANVTAIFKKGNVTSPGNYRPVSLTSIICKLLESIIRDHAMKYMDDNNLMSEDQHGFRSGRSCVTQLLEIMEMWTSMLDEGGGIDVVYLDFRKAFDSVPHQRLLKKIKAYGIEGSLLDWMESFLTGRKQKGQRKWWIIIMV